jgi:AraC-like DNA-binding protein
VADWAHSDAEAPRAARWVVFRDAVLRLALLEAHRALADEGDGPVVEEAVLAAADGLRRHLRPGPRESRGGAEHAAVRRARAHLTERWNQPIRLGELSTVAGLSPFELARRFRQQVGLPPHAFQLDLRVNNARRLLAAGETPAAVAAACGFADQPHLTRAFKRLVGVTPAAFARAAR